jgi:hypothetical protein
VHQFSLLLSQQFFHISPSALALPSRRHLLHLEEPVSRDATS